MTKFERMVKSYLRLAYAYKIACKCKECYEIGHTGMIVEKMFSLEQDYDIDSSLAFTV